MAKKISFLIAIGLIIGLPVMAAGLLPDCAGSTCKPCHFLQLISNIANYIVRNLVPPLAGLLLLIGGIMMAASAGSENRYKQGRQIIANAGIGVVIVLASWLLVNTLIQALAVKEAGYNPQTWYSISCQ